MFFPLSHPFKQRALRSCAGLVAAGLVFLTGWSLRASAPNEDVVSRYEQILERAPVEGPSFDKLLQLYQESEGLEALEARWAPKSAEAGGKGATYLLLRGLLADRMGKTNDARRLLQQATLAAPDSSSAWIALGDFESQQGKWNAAIEALQKGLATPVAGEDRLALYRKLGQAQQRDLNATAALATWQKMVAEFPRDAFAVEEVGEAELDAGQFDEARKTFQKLADLAEPNSMQRVQALMKLAEVDDRQGKTKEAVHDYETILPLTAEGSWLNREVRAQIEQIYRREDDLAGLVAYYKEWSTANPKDVDALLLLANAQEELGKKDDVLVTLRQATVLAPDRHEVRERLAEGLVEAGQYDEAIKVVTALTADDPTEPRYWQTLGEALWRKTQPPTVASTQAVLAAWGHIVPPDSKDIGAVIAVADLCRAHGLNDQALEGYRRALALNPDASDIREKTVQLLIDLQRQDEAWKLLDAMVEGNLATAANYLKLASLDARFGRTAESAAAIEKGLALDPKNFDLLSMKWNQLAEASKWDEAVALYDRLIAASPNDYFVEQTEIRQVQALAAAGKLDDTEKGLRARVGAEPGLNEAEMRLLLRMMVQQADPDVPKVLAEARKRFHQSISLTQIAIDYNRHQGNGDAAVAALQQLITLAPQQKSDWLAEIVRVRQDQGNLDAALQAAQQVIDASPSGAAGYLAYADVAIAAGKSDEAATKLQAAIKLSDKPNDIRQRLARLYLESGQGAKARAVYEEAFAAATTPQDKLAIVRAMTPAYFHDGMIDELIGRFKKQQEAEEGGWRYGLYLSAIYEQMQDFGNARRELARSLAVRPKDPALLRALITLADRDNDRAEALRYREMLVEADPSDANEIALAGEYALQDRPEDAWRIVQNNLSHVARDPLAWKDVLNQINNPDYSAKVQKVLEEAIRAQGGGSFEGRFALAQFQMQQGDLENAKRTLWEIVDEPLPPAPPTPAGAAPTAAPARAVVGRGYAGFFQGPLLQRTAQSFTAVYEAQQLLLAGQNSSAQARAMMRLRAGMGPGMMSTPSAADIKDRALVYLGVIALQQKKADNFLKQLQAKMAAAHWPLREKIMALMLLQAREPLLDAIEEEAKSGQPDAELDKALFVICAQFPNPTNDPEVHKRVEALQQIFTDRLGQDRSLRDFALQMQINRLLSDTSPEGMAKRKEMFAQFAKGVDRKDADQLVTLITLAAQVDDWPAGRQAVQDLASLDGTKFSPNVQQQLGYLPGSFLQLFASQMEKLPPDFVPTVLQLMEAGYPAAPPGAGSSSGSGAPTWMSLVNTVPGMMRAGSDGTFPPPNRYLNGDRVGMLEPMFQQLKLRGLLPAMYAALDQQEKTLGDWRTIYPRLLRIYFQWWEGRRDEVLAATRQLVEQDPSDDFKLLLASMLTQQKMYDEAINVLDSTAVRYGPEYIRTQRELLRVAVLAKNNEVGQKAALQLLATRLPLPEELQLVDSLRAVGLKDKADEIIARQNRSGGGMSNRVNLAIQTISQLAQTLNEAMNNGDSSKAIAVARQVLNRDPSQNNGLGNDTFLRTQALTALKNSGELPAYVEEIEKQLAATPDSVRLNWLAGEAWQNMPDTVTKVFGLQPLPQWLKLERKGNVFTASLSGDGKNWSVVNSGTVALPGPLYAGVWVAAERGVQPVQAHVDQITLEGKFTTAGGTAADPALPAWRQADIGSVTKPGSVRAEGQGGMEVAGPLDRAGTPKGVHFVYQMLDGDGSLVVRLSVLETPPDGNANERRADNRACLAGLMLRASLDANSAGVGLAVSPTDGAAWVARNVGPEPLVFADAEDAPAVKRRTVRELPVPWMVCAVPQFNLPLALKLTRKGATFTGSWSTDGKQWQEIFSRQVELPAKAIGGFFAQTNSSARASQIVWKDAKITGVPSDAAPVVQSGTSTIPAPWQYLEIGSFNNSGNAKGDEANFEITTPYDLVSGPSLTFGGLYQESSGDAELSGLLASVAPEYDGGWAGLAFRASTADNAPEIEFYYAHFGRLGYTVRLDTLGQTLKYYRKVAQLSPRNQGVLLGVAEQLKQAKKPGAAADLYASALKSDFASTINGRYPAILQAFDESGRLLEFVKLAEDWSPSAATPLAGGGPDMYYVMLQLGLQLEQGQHLPEAERMFRKALALDTFQTRQEGLSALVQVLIDEGRRDDAAAEIEKMMLARNMGAPAVPPILAFNIPTRAQANWLQSFGWNQNGVITSPLLHFLQLADDLGLATRLAEELKKQPKSAPASSGGLIDPDTIATLLLQIMLRDPGYRPQMEQLLKDHPPGKLNVGYNPQVFILLSQRLVKWPQERPMALKVIKQADEALAALPGNNFFRNAAKLQLARIALEAQDTKEARVALHALGTSLHEQRVMNPSQVPFEQALMVFRWMVQEGMYDEAAALLAEAKNDPQLTNGNTFYQQRMDQAEKELAFARGASSPLGLAYGIASMGKGMVVYWQVNAGQKQPNDVPLFSNTTWAEDAPTRASTYRLQVSAGPDRDHLKPVATLEKIATSGSALLKLPAGTRVVQAMLLAPKPASGKESDAAPLAVGHQLLMDEGDNLLTNPDFKVTRTVTGQAKLAGWHGVTAAAVSEEPGGPLPEGGYRTVEGGGGNVGSAEIVSDRIPLQSGADYVFSGWLKLSGNFGFRFFDQNGKLLNPNQFVYTGGTEGEWQWRAWLLSNSPSPGMSTIPIPAGAATVQVVMRLNQESAFAGLSLKMRPSLAQPEVGGGK